MKSICFAFNHFQNADGIARSAVTIANGIVSDDVNVVLRPIYKYDKKMLSGLDPRIKVEPIFRFYFKGMSKIVGALPKRVLHRLIFGTHRFDIEIGFQYGDATVAVVNSNSHKEKHIIWMHGYDEGLILKNCYLKADQVVCVSRANAARLKKELNGNGNITYAYNPVDEKNVVKSGQEEIDIKNDGKFIFSTVGRLSPEKGYSRLLDCVKKLNDHNYSFQLWIIGDGPEKEMLKRKTKDLDLQNVKFLGNQYNPHKYTSKSDVFVCSSFSEGYSTACTEAIMLGVPVLTTNVSGGEEIIKDSEAGLLVGMSDDDLYNGMKEILDNQNIVEVWKKQLLITKERFSKDNRLARIKDILDLDIHQGKA